MKTIVIASQKGGAGKSTLAGHLAVAANKAGDGPTVLIDTDPQGSLSKWWSERKNEEPALAKIKLQELNSTLQLLEDQKFSYAIIDTPPAITDSISRVVALADLVLIPTRPSPHDLRSIGETLSIVKKKGKPFSFIITQAKLNAKISQQAPAILAEYGPVAPILIHDRVDYAWSMINGNTVLEIERPGKSAEEIEELWVYVKTLLM